MKNLKNLLCFVCIVAFTIVLSNTKCFAAEIQYTEDVIPKMTSNTSPEGKASASSIYDDNYQAWNAFDNIAFDSYNGWSAEAYTTTGWLEYEFTTPKCITKYTLSFRNIYTEEMPKDWTFEAWNEETNKWDILDTQSNEIEWLSKRAFTFENDKYYNRYRINITANCGHQGVLVIADMEMMETVSEPTNNVLKVILEPKEELQLSVDEDLAENTKMTWTSSDSTVATVDGNGVVTAIKPGNTVITSKYQDGTFEESINVLVVEDAKEYRLAVDLKIGKSCRLTIDDYTFTKPVTWSVMDSMVATISNKGIVTAVSDGLTMATATDDKGEIVGQIYIRVRK